MRSQKLRRFFCIISLGLAIICANYPDVVLSQETTQEETHVDIMGAKLGAAAYVMTFGLSDIVNKTHPWLRLRAVETGGAEVNYKTLAFKPEKRKDTLIFGYQYLPNIYNATKKPKDPEYTTLKGAISFTDANLFFITLDPNIKTVKDFAGKTIGLGTVTGGQYLVPKGILEHFGIWDKVKHKTFIGFSAPCDALKNRFVDVAFSNVGRTYAPIPALVNLMATEKVYFIGLDKATSNTVAREMGWPLGWCEVPAGKLGPTHPEPFGVAWTANLGWFADAEMDEKIVYEICKTAYENIDKFGDYHAVAKAMRRENMAALSIEEKDYHPGALRFYKEKGIKAR